jgi:putative aldouronate transport system permease protein
MMKSTHNGMAAIVTKKKGYLTARLWDQRYLLILSVPFMLWIVIFKYIPIWSWIMAFQNFKFGRPFFDQKWVGLKFFRELLIDDRFWLAFRNTLGMSVLGMIFGFTLPIAFALFLNEVRSMYFKRSIQTVSYLPHFVSWVVAAGMFIKMLSVDGGVVNDILVSLHVIREPVQFMAQPKLFWLLITIAGSWKETGWNSIIYIAAIAGIDQQLYDAATVDGCGRFQKMRYVTLPGISPTIIILFIMAFGHLTQIGFEAQFLMGNAIVMDFAEVIDLYALKYGIGMARYSFGTAIGVFNSIIAITLLVTTNSIFKKIRGESIF